MANSLTRFPLKQFNGFSSEDANQFMEDFIAYCVFNNLKGTSARRIAAFQLSLSGPAKTWFATLPDGSKSDWDTLQALFKAKYSNDSGSAFLANAEQFATIRLTDDAKLEVFHSMVSDLGRKLQKSDLDIMLKFVDSLPKQLAFYVRSGNPLTPEDALTSAKMGEAYGYRTSSPQVPVTHSFSEIHPSVNAMENRITELSMQVQSLQMDKTPNRCFRCGGLNHTQRLCNWAGGASDADVVCQLCTQQGHSARSCRLNSQTRSPGGGSNIVQGNGWTPSGRGRGRLGRRQ